MSKQTNDTHGAAAVSSCLTHRATSQGPGYRTKYVYGATVGMKKRDKNNVPQVTCTCGRDLSGSLQGAGGIGGLLARTSNSQLLSPSSSAAAHAFYHCDGNGNITCLIDGNQAIVAKYLYDPYGNLLSQSGSLADANLYRFSSKEFHTASGLVYYLYRFYDPNLQRWPNRDPLSAKTPQHVSDWTKNLFVEMSQGPNLYWPFGNDPVSKRDNDGQFVPLIICCVVAGVVLTGCSRRPPPPERQFPDCWPSRPPIPGAGKWSRGEQKRACDGCCASTYGNSPSTGDPKTDDFLACLAYCAWKAAYMP